MTDRATDKPRICRTPEEVFAAGREATANFPPLTPAQVIRVAALLGPYLRASLDAKIAKQLAEGNPGPQQEA
ncbi:MAG: hypothetical protein ABR585_07270 [Gemmatimonadaceae bacterium]